MNGKQLADALLVELGKRKRGLFHRSFDEDSFADLIRSALDPQPEQPNFIPSATLPVIPPEWPKLKVKYDGKTGAEMEWIIVNNAAEEAPYHEWYNRPMAEADQFDSGECAGTTSRRMAAKKTTGRKRETVTYERATAFNSTYGDQQHAPHDARQSLGR